MSTEPENRVLRRGWLRRWNDRVRSHMDDPRKRHFFTECFSCAGYGFASLCGEWFAEDPQLSLRGGPYRLRCKECQRIFAAGGFK